MLKPSERVQFHVSQVTTWASICKEPNSAIKKLLQLGSVASTFEQIQTQTTKVRLHAPRDATKWHATLS